MPRLKHLFNQILKTAVDLIFMIFIFSPISIIWKYIVCKLKLLKTRKKYDHHFDKSTLDLSQDWFSTNIRSWIYTLYKARISPNSEMNILEVGSFEGCSTYFLLEFFNQSKVTAVDTWEGSIKHKGKVDFSKVEKRFDKNISPYIHRLNKIKSDSNHFFITMNKQSFDLIYIDGDHRPRAVYQDAVQAFSVLNPKGILIFDDFNWRYNFDLSQLPGPGIVNFIKDYHTQLKVIYVGYQIHLQKIE